MNTVNIKLYQILKNDFYLSDERAKEFAQVINNAAREITSVSEFKNNIKENLSRLDSNLISGKKYNKTLLKWSVGLFIALALMIIGL